MQLDPLSFPCQPQMVEESFWWALMSWWWGTCFHRNLAFLTVETLHAMKATAELNTWFGRLLCIGNAFCQVVCTISPPTFNITIITRGIITITPTFNITIITRGIITITPTFNITIIRFMDNGCPWVLPICSFVNPTLQLGRINLKVFCCH